MANEQYYVPDLPVLAAGAGVKTPYGIVLLPPGGKVAAYVRSGGPQDGDDTTYQGNLVTTLASGLARCRANQGDTVVVLPGHSESGVGTTMMTNLVAGTRIIGIGRGSKMPVFRWTATTDNWAVSKADVQISGLRLRLEGANGVTEAITWTGADGLLAGNDIEVASGAALKAAIAVNLSTGADRMVIQGNIWRGTATHNVTDGLKITAALDQVRVLDNEMVFSATAANGNIHVTAAATNIKVGRNILYNTHTSSTACIAVDAVAADGVFWENYYATVNNGTVTSQGVTFGAGALIRSFLCHSNDEPQKSGVLTPAAAT
jgi:hypothetical protein